MSSGRADFAADGYALDREALPVAMVCLHEDADRVAAVLGRQDPRGRADPTLEAVADHPGPAADIALGDGAAGSRFERCEDMGGLHVQPVDVVEPPVPRLADNGQAPGVLGHDAPADRPLDERVPYDPDRVRVREPDRRREQAGLPDPFEPGQLAVAVESMAAGEKGVATRIAFVREDDGHAGSDVVALDQRRVADAHAGDIGDRIVETGSALAYRDPELAGLQIRPRRTYAAAASRTSAAHCEAPRDSSSPASDSSSCGVALPGRSLS